MTDPVYSPYYPTWHNASGDPPTFDTPISGEALKHYDDAIAAVLQRANDAYHQAVAAATDPRLAGSLQKGSNLVDLPSASIARTNLGLGAAATRTVGTGAGQVAAGDDPRFSASNGGYISIAFWIRGNLTVGSGTFHALPNVTAL